MRPLLIAGALALGVASAATAPAPAHAQAQPDFKKAAEHYKAGEAAMAAEMYLDAAREYAIAYEITRDPVLFFKIATANDKGGKCDVAVTYYRRYLKEGKPDDEYKKLTEQRIAVCEGRTSDLAGAIPTAPTPPPPAPTTAPAPTPPAPAPAPTTPAEAPAAETAPAPSGEAATDEVTGTASLPPPSSGNGPSALTSAGWIAVGVSAAATTVGAVMALSGNSTEQDIEDLEGQRVDGRPVPFDRETRTRYDELVDEGERFNTLAIVSFSVAGVAAVTAGTLFFLGSRDGGDERDGSALRVTPSVSREGATITAGWRF